MSNNSNIRVSREVKNKLDKIKENTKLTHSDIVLKLLTENEGAFINDVHEIHREKIALTLYYHEYDLKNKIFIDNDEYEVTFKELKESKVDDIFCAKQEIAEKFYINTTLKILFNDGISVFARLTETMKTPNSFKENIECIHIELL